MAKGQKRSGREAKKPKAEVKKAAPQTSFLPDRGEPPKKAPPPPRPAE